MIVKQWFRSAASRRHDTATAKAEIGKPQASRLGLLVTGGLFALSCAVAPITLDLQQAGVDLQAAHAKGGNSGNGGNGGNGGNSGNGGGGSSSAGTGQGGNGNGQGQGNAGQGVASSGTGGQASATAPGSQNTGRAGTHGAIIQWIVVTWPKL